MESPIDRLVVQRYICTQAVETGSSRQARTFLIFLIFFSISLVLLQFINVCRFEYIIYPLICCLLRLSFARPVRFYKCTIVSTCSPITSDQPLARN